MPIVSGGGGGGGPATGSYLPVANKTGVTVDSTTYNDTIRGGGAKLTALVFPHDQGALAFAISGDAFPRFLIGTDLNDAGIALSDGTFDPNGGGASMFLTGGGTLGLNGYAAPALASVLATGRSAGSGAITNLANPSSAQDAATKAYVDARAVVVTQETTTGANVSIANTASANMTWDSPAGDALLNLTDPTTPLPVVSGIYAITVSVGPTAMTVGGQFSAAFTLGGATVIGKSSAATAAASTPALVLTLVRYTTTGQGITVQVTSLDGAATRNFVLNSSVQRIS